MNSYICSHCGVAAYYDGRCGDGPVLMCDCDKGAWIDDGRGGYYANPHNAQPVKGTPTKKPVPVKTNWSREDD
jgi:hypothetical protein